MAAASVQQGVDHEFLDLARQWDALEAEMKQVLDRIDEVNAAAALREPDDPRRREEVRQELGWEVLNDRQADLSDAQTRVEERAMLLRARTAEAVAFKARLVKRYADLGDPEEFFTRLLLSLLDDLEA